MSKRYYWVCIFHSEEDPDQFGSFDMIGGYVDAGYNLQKDLSMC
jgi:hypothetical protein